MDSITASHRANNFDTLRLFAALAVVLSHSIPLTYGPTHFDVLWAFSHGRATLGSVAIQVFFIISGYLITASYLHGKSAIRFIRARFLRLVPALIAVLCLLAFIAGPLLTPLPLHAYFCSTQPYRAAIGLSDHLPGVFSHNPFSSGIDGSLWTLRYEALCYVFVFILGQVGGLRGTVVMPLFFLLLMARMIFGNYAGLEFGAQFAAGATLFFLHPKLSPRFAILCFVLWIASMRLGGFVLISDTLGAYLIITLGLAPTIRLPNFSRYGDFSYGVYIYAWPIQQTISLLLGRHATAFINCVIAIPISLACAFVSWHLVEHPALTLKDKPFPRPYAPARI